jgi:site-specific recombinase XerD
LLETGYAIQTVQELLMHPDLKTTIIYTYVLNKGRKAVRWILTQIYNINLPSVPFTFLCLPV